MFSKQAGKNRAGRVVCTVGTCSHHGTGNCCNAGSIKVGTEYALDKTETFCSTYSHRPEL